MARKTGGRLVENLGPPAFQALLLAAALLAVYQRWQPAPPQLHLQQRALAAGLKEHGFLGRPGRPSAYHSPLYPVLIAAADPAPPEPPMTWAVQALLGGVLALAVGWLGLMALGPLAGLLGAAGAAFHPQLIAQSSAYGITSLLSALLALAAGASGLWLAKPDSRRAMAAGMALSVAILCRASLVLLPAVLAAAAWTVHKKKRGHIVLFLLAAYLPLAPWLARNMVLFGSLMAVKLSAGLFYERLWSALSLHGPLLLAALASVPAARNAPALIGTWVMVLYYLLAHSGFVLEPRAFEPVLPLIMLLAACGAVFLLRRLFEKRPKAPDVVFQRLATRGLALAGIAVMVPLYLLTSAALGRETALSEVPCRLPETAQSLAACGMELEREGDHQAAGQRMRRALLAGADGALRAELLKRLARLPGQGVASRPVR